MAADGVQSTAMGFGYYEFERKRSLELCIIFVEENLFELPVQAPVVAFRRVSDMDSQEFEQYSMRFPTIRTELSTSHTTMAHVYYLESQLKFIEKQVSLLSPPVAPGADDKDKRIRELEDENALLRSRQTRHLRKDLIARVIVHLGQINSYIEDLAPLQSALARYGDPIVRKAYAATHATARALREMLFHVEGDLGRIANGIL